MSQRTISTIKKDLVVCDSAATRVGLVKELCEALEAEASAAKQKLFIKEADRGALVVQLTMRQAEKKAEELGRREGLVATFIDQHQTKSK